MNVTNSLVESSLDSKFDKLPTKVIDKVKQHLLDCIGIAICASREVESNRSIIEAVKTLSKEKGNCTVVANQDSYLPHYAALLNGTFIHSLDFDDTHRQSSVHPGASVVAVLLALGEAHDISGKDFITAATVGYDVAGKLGKAINPSSHYERGFHPTATVGVFAATAAGANLLGLSKSELSNAFGLNGSQTAGSMQYLKNGAWNKRLHPGLAAHNAILALALARSGVIGAALPFEGKNGFFASYSNDPNPDKAIEGLGDDYEVLSTALKPYPCCRYAHGGIDLVIKIVQSNNLKPEDIEKILVETAGRGVEIIGRPLEKKRNPQNIVDAQFSMPFNAAVAVLVKRVTLNEYKPKYIHNPTVKELMDRVLVKANSRFDRVYPGKWCSRVTIKTKHETFAEETSFPRGEPENPLVQDDVIKKFHDLTFETFDEERRKNIINTIMDFENLSSISRLMNLLK